MKYIFANVSTFGRGYINKSNKAVLQTSPMGEVSIEAIAEYITSEKAKNATEKLRTIEDHEQAQEFKKLNFEFFTAGGTFSYRKANSLTKESGLMVLDVDGLTPDEVGRVRKCFIEDQRVTSILVFTSPSGNGVKAVVERDSRHRGKFKDEFLLLGRYFLFEYGIILDKSGSDISRACYLPYDPTCYLHPELIKNI